MQAAYYSHQRPDEVEYYDQHHYPDNPQYPQYAQEAPSDSASGSRHRKKKKHREADPADPEGSERRHHRRHKKRDGVSEDGLETAEGGSSEGHRKKRHHRRREPENGDAVDRGMDEQQWHNGQQANHEFQPADVVATEYTFEDAPYSRPGYDEHEDNQAHGEYYHPEEGDNYQHQQDDHEPPYAHVQRNDEEHPPNQEQYWHDHEGEGQYHPDGHQDSHLQWNDAPGPESTPAAVVDEDVLQPGKKKSSGIGKFLSSFRSGSKKKRGPANASTSEQEHWQSNPQLFMPNVDSRAGTMDRGQMPAAGSRGKSGRSSSKARQDMADVVLLDGDRLPIVLSKKCNGDELLKKVCAELNLVEMDYFGLTWVSNKVKTWFWLDMEKRIDKQLRHGENWLFHFQVKFYPPEPNLIMEDITRYQLCLQLRHDVFTGKLPCSWVTHALLGAYMVQSELGDYAPELHDTQGLNYVREFEFFHKQDDKLLARIVDLHKSLRGTTPDQADLKYLEAAKRLEHYGIDLHPAWDSEGVQIFIGVSYHGVFVYKEKLRLSRFAWPKILRISFKKNFFYLKIRSDVHENVEGVIGFRLMTHHFAKRLWKTAIEHHTFFRLKETKHQNKNSPWFFSTLTFGSRHRFSGRTLHQHRTMSIDRPHPSFDRTLSKRTASMPMGLNSQQYGSIHSLHRAHPRDMTVGKTQSVEYLGPPKRYGSATQPLNELGGGGPSARGGIFTRTHQEPFTSPIQSRGYIGGDPGMSDPPAVELLSPQMSDYRAMPQPQLPPKRNSGGPPPRGPPSLSGGSVLSDASQQPVHQSRPAPANANFGSNMYARPLRPNSNTVTAVPTYVAASDHSYTEEPYANMPAPPEDLRYQEDDYDENEML